MMRHSMAFFCPILRFGVMLFLSFSFCLASGEEYGGRTIDVHGESVPSSRDMKKADAVSSFCEEFLEYRYGKDVEPLHYLTFYLYEKNGWKMRKCNRRWSDFMDDSIEIMQNLYFGSMWTDSVREPLPVPAEGLCIIQVITGRPNMVRTAFKLAHPRLRIPQCKEVSYFQSSSPDEIRPIVIPYEDRMKENSSTENPVEEEEEEEEGEEDGVIDVEASPIRDDTLLNGT